MFARTQLIFHFFVYKQINRTQKSPLIRSFFLDKLCEPQTIAVVRHRWLFIIKNNDIRWLSLVSSMKNIPYELFFPMTIYACYWIYACLFTVSFDKFPNGNEMHLITLNFHLIDETRTFLGFLFRVSMSKRSAIYESIIWELHFSGTN